MKSGRVSRRSIRYSIFIGVLAGSVFAGSGAQAETLTQDNFYEIIQYNLAGDYVLGSDIDVTTVVRTEDGIGGIIYSAPTGSSVFATFSGSLEGNGMKISGLEIPLFNEISGESASVTNLILEASAEGVSGKGMLANIAAYGAEISNVHAVGNVDGGSLWAVGGLVGEVDADVDVLNSSFVGNVSSTGSHVGGLLGVTNGGDVINSSASGIVTGADFVAGLVGWKDGGVISGSSSKGDVSGISFVGGLAGFAGGNITNSFSTANISSTGGSFIGGLVGQGTVNISNSYSTGNIITINGQTVGGLIGLQGATEINNSYASGKVVGASWIGGLVGSGNGTQIMNSYASGDIEVSESLAGGIIGAGYSTYMSNVIATGNVIGSDSSSQLGGIAGYSEYSTIEDISYLGDLNGYQNIGGLVGYAGNNVEITRGKVIANITGNSYLGGVTGSTETGFNLSSTLVNADIIGIDIIGGLIGFARGASTAADIQITNSHWKGTIDASIPSRTASLIAYAHRGDDTAYHLYYIDTPTAFPTEGNSAAIVDGVNVVGRVTSPIWDGEVLIENASSVLENFSSKRQLGNTWAICASINGENPYLISQNPIDPCELIQQKQPKLEKFLRDSLNSKTVEKIEQTRGFKNETPLPKNAAISFIEATEKIDLAKVKAVEIAPTANVRVNATAGEALQISLKSESKDPVELWVKSPDGTWLLAGVITFDKDGKAILPALQFKNAGDYTLVLNKPSADSAKGSAPLNQSGSVLVAVS